MNIYFSGIGGVGIGPLAEIAHDAGFTVAGSDAHESLVTTELSNRGIVVATGQDGTFLQAQHEAAPIDWFIYTAALPEDHPELLLAKSLGIRTAKRDELLAHIIKEKNLKLIAVAGTHGKTTTTSLAVWAAQQLGVPVSYSIGSTLSWGPSGRYVPGSEYFIYECDEFDRNFLHFTPYISVVTSIEHDHIDTYATEQSYFDAFGQFARQSDALITWDTYRPLLGTEASFTYLTSPSPLIQLHGKHNRQNASLLLPVFRQLGYTNEQAAAALNTFAGANRRFEKLADNLYTDYGHTPTEIAATLQLARELSDTVTLVYQPHQNRRQHEIKDLYTDEVFQLAANVYWVPTYLSREQPGLAVLTPEELTSQLTHVTVSHLDASLWQTINSKRHEGSLVLLMGAGDIDAWARQQLATDV